MEKKSESNDDLKYLLGNMGIEILIAIFKGAKNFETIKLFSGIPLECIRGRIPVLLGLKLIEKKKDEYFLTQKGIEFKNSLNKNL
jgi:predicted transcriptional regulator